MTAALHHVPDEALLPPLASTANDSADRDLRLRELGCEKAIEALEAEIEADRFVVAAALGRIAEARASQRRESAALYEVRRAMRGGR